MLYDLSLVLNTSMFVCRSGFLLLGLLCVIDASSFDFGRAPILVNGRPGSRTAQSQLLAQGRPWPG
jgi:hypothetical protein